MQHAGIELPAEPSPSDTEDTRARPDTEPGSADYERRQTVSAFLALSKKRWQTADAASTRFRTAMRRDQLFAAGGGNQWEIEDRQARADEGRPCIEINRIPQFIRQVSNQNRANRSQIKISPRGSGSTLKLASAIQGLVRGIEVESDADVAYDTGTQHQLISGLGFVRLIAAWAPGDAWEQVCRLKRVRNPLAVYWDPSTQEADFSDCRWMHVIGVVGKDEYEARWGKVASYQSLSEYMAGQRTVDDWAPEGKIVIAEYYTLDVEERTQLRMHTGQTIWQEELEPFQQMYQLAHPGEPPADVVAERPADKKVVRWCFHNGLEILEGNEDKTAGRELPGTRIPIYPVMGDELDLDGVVDYRGMVRDAIDPQRMYNFWSALALDTKIPTPKGWSTIEALRVGDEVFDASGQPCQVLGKSPVHENHSCFKVTFDDGSSIVADGGHEWTVEERGKRRDPTWVWTTKNVTTADLTPKKHFIWVTKPLELPEVNLPIHPYALGVWLGDGTSSCAQISQGFEDVQPLRSALMSVGYHVGPAHQAKDSARFTINGFSGRLREAGLLNNKHIPAIYLRGSREQRLALLQGLMDTDGSISEKLRVCEFTTISTVLRDGFAEVLASLGIKARCTLRPSRPVVKNRQLTKYIAKPAYQFSFTCPKGVQVFRLQRKADLCARTWKRHPRRTERHRIVSVEPLPSVLVQCIGVSSETHLYLAGPGMVPTHNSSIAEAVALAPKAPWVAAKGQVEQYMNDWSEANRKAKAVLLYDPKAVGDQLVPPPQRNTVEPAIQAMTMGLAEADRDLMSVMGLFQPSLGERGTHTESGKAREALVEQGVVANSNFLDNLQRTKRSIGRSLLEWIPVIYDVPRIEHLLHPDGKKKAAVIYAGEANKPQPGEFQNEDGTDMTEMYDVSVLAFDVTVSTGPSHETQRQATQAWLLELFKVLPQLAAIGADILLDNSDDEAAQQLGKRYKKSLPPQLQDEGDPEAQLPILQAKLQQTTDLLDKAHAAIGTMAKVIETQELSNDTKKQVAMIQADAALSIAESKIGSDRDIKAFQAEAERFHLLVGQIHEETIQDMQADQEARQLQAAQAHEGQQADAQRQHETATQGADQQHEQQQQRAQQTGAVGQIREQREADEAVAKAQPKPAPGAKR